MVWAWTLSNILCYLQIIIIIRKLPVQSETNINPDPHPLDKERDKPMSLILVPQLDTDTVLIMSSVIFTIFGCVLIMM